jgi:hypothetical protein
MESLSSIIIASYMEFLFISGFEFIDMAINLVSGVSVLDE